MSPDDKLPDPAELFRRMQSEDEQGPEAESSSLPDPAELFRRMSGAEDEDSEEVEGLFPEEETDLEGGLFPGDEPEAGESFPDSDELFARMKAHRELPDAGALFDQLASDEDSSETLFDPGEMRGRTLGVDLGGDEPEAGGESCLPNPAELFRQMEEERTQDRVEPVPELRLLRPEPEEEPGSLPDPAALFRQMEEEQMDEEPEVTERLPNPARLFEQMKSSGLLRIDNPLEADPEPEAEVGQGRPALPDLPDLEALKAEMDAEAQANLDDDLLGDLSGPERFVPTVGDSLFTRPPSFAKVPEESTPPPLPEPEPEPKAVPPKPEPKAKESPGKPAPKVSEKATTVRVGDTPSVVPRAPQKPKKDATPLPPASSSSGSGGGLKLSSPKPRKESGASTAVMSGGAAQRRVQPKKEGGAMLASGGGLKLFKRTPKIGRHDLCIFTRQLSAMLKAGIPLHLGVAFCSESDPDLAPILDDVVKKIEGGYSFSAALKEYPDSFDPVYVGLVNAGELSGRLNEMLARLADVLEREIELRKRLISVITYPAVLLGVSLLGTIGFILFVLPQLTPLFMDLDVDLPLPTQILLGFRQVMVPLMIVSIVAGVAGFFAQDTVKAYIRSKPVLELRLAAIPFDIPVVGGVYEKIVTARVLYALATMLDVGVTMAQALSRAEITCGNAFIAHRLQRAREDLCDGNSVTDCFRINTVFPPTALHLIAAGEESAQLTTMFSYVAKHYDEDVENALDAAASMLEPLIMVFMGCIVGFIVIAAALPTIKLLQAF